ncbi:hypothetical protein KK083_09470 [Fulvivirgaceae bacterium PWU4]|uniref:BACON domain-containing protein n=1 Tax=Chryseosolibacter histidini TaxID=2782349 RepID=A0AAP2GML0_9BACT|nr:hypothetical protein [Chryseosolibacter histidini]MBT1697103.1 hypothetical protein [Chryseosolibacter histidini]
MKTNVLSISLCLITLVSYAQETFDLATYTIPAGWRKVNNTATVVGYAITNNQRGTYAQIVIYSSTTSKGSLRADFESEWQELVVKPYKPTVAAQLTPAESSSGWDAQAGAAPFEFNGAQSAAMLVTATGYGRCMSIVVVTNTSDYEQEVQNFLESVDLSKPLDNQQTVANNNLQQPEKAVSLSAGKGSYHFSTSNFDDGWVSTVQEDWVQVTKGNIRVLLHFNSNKVDVSSADHATISNNAWNTLAAPRYSNLANYHALGATLSYERPSLISGDVTDNQSGKRVFVALFKKGKSGWIEIICPDKPTFVNTFGVDGSKVDYYAEDNIWNALLTLPGYNKFAVDAGDLHGTWSSGFTGATQYVNAITGANAGMDSYSSSEKFEFGPGRSYQWNASSASGMVGNLKFQGAKSNGTFSLPNHWQVSFSDIEGKPKTYNAFFSCVKGGRILWLGETGYGRVD